MEQKYIQDLHTEHREWLSKCSFYKDELHILRNRIAEIALGNTSKDILAQVERFQNQLIVQQTQLEQLRHNIKEQENIVEKSILDNPTATDHRKIDDHSNLRDQVATFDRLFSAMKQELTEFVARQL
jgi:hypothetical protein